MAQYRSQQRHPSSRKARQRSSVWLWIFMGMFLGALATISIYTVMPQNGFYKPKQVVSLASKHKGNSAPLAVKHKASGSSVAYKHKGRSKNVSVEKRDTSQKFEFYNLLSGTEVPLPDLDPPKPTHLSKQPTPTKQPKGAEPPKGAKVSKPPLKAAQYLIQAGVFRKFKEANTLKTKLAFHKFTPHIQKIETTDGSWFRVILGPFRSESLAKKQKKSLENRKIRGILVLQPH